MDDWIILQNFYNRLTPTAYDHINAAAGGAFFSLTIDRAQALIAKMVSNQCWNEERLQPRQRGMHTVKETNMLAAKLDLLKKFEERPQAKAPMQALQAVDAHMTCEVCGNTGHSGNDCPTAPGRSIVHEQQQQQQQRVSFTRRSGAESITPLLPRM
jgi:rubrerythrin